MTFRATVKRLRADWYGGIQVPSAMRLILSTAIGASIGAKNLIPEEVDYTKIIIRVTVMNKVQLLLASQPCEPLKARSLEKDVRVKRRRTCNYHHHKKI
jgi:hypothetical protein